MKTTQKPGTEEWAREFSPPHDPKDGEPELDPRWCCAAAEVVVGGLRVLNQCCLGPKVHYGRLGYCRKHDPAPVAKALDEQWQNQRSEKAKADRARKAANTRYINKQRRKLAKAYHSARQEVKTCETNAERSALLMKLLGAVEGSV